MQAERYIMTETPITVGDILKKFNGVNPSLPVYLQCIDKDFDADFMKVIDIQARDLHDVFHPEYNEDNLITFTAICMMYE